MPYYGIIELPTAGDTKKMTACSDIRSVIQNEKSSAPRTIINIGSSQKKSGKSEYSFLANLVKESPGKSIPGSPPNESLPRASIPSIGALNKYSLNTINYAQQPESTENETAKNETKKLREEVPVLTIVDPTLKNQLSSLSLKLDARSTPSLSRVSSKSTENNEQTSSNNTAKITETELFEAMSLAMERFSKPPRAKKTLAVTSTIGATEDVPFHITPISSMYANSKLMSWSSTLKNNEDLTPKILSASMYDDFVQYNGPLQKNPIVVSLELQLLEMEDIVTEHRAQAKRKQNQFNEETELLHQKLEFCYGEQSEFDNRISALSAQNHLLSNKLDVAKQVLVANSSIDDHQEPNKSSRSLDYELLSAGNDSHYSNKAHEVQSRNYDELVKIKDIELESRNKAYQDLEFKCSSLSMDVINLSLKLQEAIFSNHIEAKGKNEGSALTHSKASNMVSSCSTLIASQTAGDPLKVLSYEYLDNEYQLKVNEIEMLKSKLNESILSGQQDSKSQHRELKERDEQISLYESKLKESEYQNSLMKLELSDITELLHIQKASIELKSPGRESLEQKCNLLLAENAELNSKLKESFKKSKAETEGYAHSLEKMNNVVGGYTSKLNVAQNNYISQETELIDVKRLLENAKFQMESQNAAKILLEQTCDSLSQEIGAIRVKLTQSLSKLQMESEVYTLELEKCNATISYYKSKTEALDSHTSSVEYDLLKLSESLKIQKCESDLMSTTNESLQQRFNSLSTFADKLNLDLNESEKCRKEESESFFVDMQKFVSRYQSKIVELETQCSKYINEISALTELMESIRTTSEANIHILEENYKTLTSQLHNLDLELKESTKFIYSQSESHKQELANCNTDLIQHKSKIHDLEHQCETLNKAISDISLIETHNRIKNDELADINHLLQEQNNGLTELYRLLHEQNKEVMTASEAKSREFECLQKQHLEITKKNEDRDTKEFEKTQRLKNARRIVVDSEGRLQSMSAQLMHWSFY